MTKRSQARRKKSQQTLIWASVILAVVVLISIWIGGQASRSVLPPIPVDEAAQKWTHGAFVLDVRSIEEWEQGHIPDSVAIPLDELPDRLSEIPRDREILVVCSLGERSQEGLEILVEAGFEQATCMSGGITRWEARGYPIETGP